MASPKSRLPSWSDGILRRLFRGFELEDRLGDLEENLGERRGGSAGSNLAILAAILRLALAKARLNTYWSFGMLKNFVTIAFRNLRRDKVAAFITISGLSLGLAAFLLISRWVWHELSYDRFHDQAASIYRVSERRAFPDRTEASFRTPGPLAAALRAEVPEIASVVRVAMTGERVVRGGDKTFYEIGIIGADREFFEVFTFPLVQGRPETALADPLTIVLSRRMARKYFGTESPLGRTLVLDNRLSFRVSGVMGDVPSNSIPLGISNRDNGDIYRRYKDALRQNPKVVSASAAFTHPSEPRLSSWSTKAAAWTANCRSTSPRWNRDSSKLWASA